VRGKSFRRSALFLILLVASAIFCGCNRAGSEVVNNSAPASPSPRKPLTAFERDLEYVRIGRFTNIYVIARQDNAALNKEDITYLKENTPKETNQWVSTEENRRVIAGTNFPFTPEHLDALRKRFTVEDYSGK
jgi:hypothetical protein